MQLDKNSIITDDMLQLWRRAENVRDLSRRFWEQPRHQRDKDREEPISGLLLAKTQAEEELLDYVDSNE